MSDDLTNAPGLGAEALASRAARRAARLRADQSVGAVADGAVAEQLRHAVRRQRNYSQGAEGERLVAQALGFLERYGWVALHDVHWPGRPQANIDHIAVGPGGIVVIDAKNWTGDVQVKDGVLRQNGYSRARETAAAAEATSAVTSRLAPQHRTATHAVLCLVGHDIEQVVVGQTTVVGRSALVEHLVGLPARLTAYDVADVARMLAGDLAGDRSPAVLTSRDLEGLAEAPRSSLRQYRASRAGADRGHGSPVRPARAAPRAVRRPAGSRRGRTLRVLMKMAVVVAIVVYAPSILSGITQAALDSAVTSTLTPPASPAPVPDPVPAAPEPAAPTP